MSFRASIFLLVLFATALSATARIPRPPAFFETGASGEQFAYEPYQGEGADNNIIHGEYFIHFRPNHTLDLHQKYIGRNISSSKKFHLFNGLPGYFAALDNYTLHELIRRDPGVVFVENDLMMRMA